MMRTVLILGLLIFGTISAEAATFSITTTPEQDTALQVLRQKLNKDRPTPLTALEFHTYLVTQWLDGLVSQAGTHDQTTLREAWEKADDATRAKVKTDLGLQ
jgi:hypothetical protein